jgi:SNF2 family DNA or RNA helicase
MQQRWVLVRLRSIIEYCVCNHVTTNSIRLTQCFVARSTGKTLQSISILAYHWEYLRIQGPHLICVPKSTLSNWMNELQRWCPSLRAIKFHGSREEREYMIEHDFNNEAAAHDGKRPDKQIMNEKGELIDDNTSNPRSWDVCVTTCTYNDYFSFCVFYRLQYL